MTTLLATSIDVLDRKLSGGIPAGSLVALTARPDSQSEQLLYQLTNSRETLYVTTQRSERAVEATLAAARGRPDHTEIVCVRAGESADPFGDLEELLAGVEGPANVIVDPMDTLERYADEEYGAFLDGFQERLVDTGSLGILHCLTGRRVPAARDTTQYMADIVFELSTDVRGEAIENRLLVPKFRCGAPFEEAIKLELTTEVAIDTSRDIA